MRPRIGITTSFKDQEQQLNRNYVLAVEKAGGLPVIMPMLDNVTGLDTLVTMLDALIITGGPAIEVGLIGALPGDISPTDPVRTRNDMYVAELFLNRKKPILGICYGMQLLNAIGNGSIYADVELQLKEAGTHSKGRGATEHPIEIEKHSLLADILGTETLQVNTRHIQALANVGDAYRISARADDGVIEAIEHESGRVLGVQFHPEDMGETMLPLFRHLIDVCSSNIESTVRVS